MATTTKAKAKAVETAEVVETPVAAKPKKVKKFNRDDEIECISTTVGALVLVGAKTKTLYHWADYGDTAYVAYEDLLALYTTKSVFLVRPLFVINDDDLVEQWANLLAPVYTKMENDDVDLLFSLKPDAFKAKLVAMPDGMKDSVRTKASQKIADGSLYDIRVIKICDEVLGTAFVDLVI